ncbi:TraU family protein [Sutterella sp.]|uniref:TraU family protein n=1 Tax=Sutterella sp. TaxID=1981025 RepID=UPI0026DF5349|nr:TraU family protein [Sutterella sp.]MDO5531901.1 TraU family protein [Sutterella sp.]
MTSRFRQTAAALAAAFPLILAIPAGPAQAATASCPGRIINPVTDICWSCLLPITAAGATVAKSGSLPDYDTDAKPVCSCGTGVNLRVGVSLSFWEPLRTAEVVRHSWCFPSLGGLEMEPGDLRAKDQGRTPKRFGTTRRTAFWQVHWYHSPWLFVLETLLDHQCLEQAPWDLAYLSELDPLWDDTLLSFVLTPEAALTTSGAAIGVCAVDCVLASAGASEKTLYWCSGCQGSVFPLSGWMAGQNSPLQAWHLMAHRFAQKLTREGVLWTAHGQKGQCGPYWQPIFEKPAWRTQLIYPSRTTSKETGACCQPLGRSTAIWGSGKSWPYTGEDGAVLLWRKRDCCVAVSGTDVATASVHSSTAEGIAALRAE